LVKTTAELNERGGNLRLVAESLALTAFHYFCLFHSCFLGAADRCNSLEIRNRLARATHQLCSVYGAPLDCGDDGGVDSEPVQRLYQLSVD
jgi:hypothetical protein